MICFYDFEIFKYWWCVVIMDMAMQTTHVIQDKYELEAFYNKHKADIWVSYNGKGYDQYLLKGIIMGYDPYKINDWIINQNQPGWKFSKEFRKIPLHNYDCIVRRGGTYVGLKELQYHMGSSIVECDVPWNLDRPLTNEEKSSVIEYCKNDVMETVNVFLNTKDKFDAHLGLVKMYSLPLSDIDKTDAGLTAKVLKADRIHGRNDQFNIVLPNTLHLSKYKHIADWYMNPLNQDYNCTLTETVHGLPIDYAWGGFHGAVPKSRWNGLIIDTDVTSLYPSLMIEYGLLSRNIPEEFKGLYAEIKDNRVKLKKEKNPLQAALKLILNTTYGILKDVNNPMYDPLMSNLVCLYGQLLMTDLIEKLEIALDDNFELIQVNTDGIFVKLKSKEYLPVYEEVCNKWSDRTRLGLEHDFYTRMVQKDVNNYIAVKQDGSLHRKGAYVKELRPMDYELAIVNKALVEYFTKDVPVEDTINNCKNLKDFQMCCKLSSNYDYLVHGYKKLDHKYYRVFASKERTDAGMYKVKGKSKQKIANTPEHCFIVNEDVNDKRCPRRLDKDYYIRMAYDRIEQYMGYDVKQMRLW